MDITTLANRISAKLGITIEASETAAETYLQEIESLEQRTIDREDIDPDTAEFVEESVFRAQRAGDMGHKEEALLDEALEAYRKAEDDLATAQQQRDQAILAALGAGSKMANLVRQTGLSRARLEQIRKSAR